MLLREHWEDEQAELAMRGELTQLDLGDCQIGDDGAETVAVFLKHDETVKKVHLYRCSIGPRGVEAIAKALKHNRTLWFLNLRFSRMGNDCAVSLIETLSRNVTINLLLVEGCNITPELSAKIQYLAETRNAILIPAAVRRVSLHLIFSRRNIAGAGNLACFPKEIVKMIAIEVYATRRESIWINALSESERTGEPGDWLIQ